MESHEKNTSFTEIIILKTYCSLLSVICSLVNDVSSICVVVLFFFNRSAGNVIAGNLLSALVPEIIYYYVLLTVWNLRNNYL